MITEHDKRVILTALNAIIDNLIGKNDADSETHKPKPIMCTVKECSKYSGMSDYTIRTWVHQGKVHYIRAGEGKNGKILISKSSLDEYLAKLA